MVLSWLKGCSEFKKRQDSLLTKNPLLLSNSRNHLSLFQSNCSMLFYLGYFIIVWSALNGFSMALYRIIYIRTPNVVKNIGEKQLLGYFATAGIVFSAAVAFLYLVGEATGRRCGGVPLPGRGGHRPSQLQRLPRLHRQVPGD